MSILPYRFVLSAAIAGAMVASLAAFRPPPGGGGGGGGDTGGGTIYFFRGDSPGTWTMNSDGSNKQLLLSDFVGVPGSALHAGLRWFLFLRAIEGSFDPDGAQRMELVAMDENTNTVVLPIDPSLSIRSAGWMTGDSGISFIGREWLDGQVVDGGIYTAAILHDVDGNINGLEAPQLLFPLPIVPEILWPEATEYSLSPDQWSVVYGTSVRAALYIVDGNGTRMLVSGSDISSPNWSPNGTAIMYRNYRHIATIKPDGSGRKDIVKSGPSYTVASPSWSPTGSHIVYWWYENPSGPPPWPERIYRATSGGGSRTNLTGDLQERMTKVPLGWR